MSFIHLRNHSAYSLAQGAIRVDELVELAVQHKMPAVAITDSGNLFGALEFATKAAKAGIQPIIGCEIITEYNGNNGQLTLLAKNETGYLNLLKIVSDSFIDGSPENPDPIIPFTELITNHDGIICLGGGTNGLVAEYGKDSLVEELKSAFGDRFYIELNRLSDEQQSEARLVELAYKHNVPLVATNNCFFATKDMHKAHDALICIAGARYVTEDDRPKYSDQHYFKNSSEMEQLFADIPEAIINSKIIAQRCSFMPVESAPMLPHFDTGDGRDEAEELRFQANEGLKKRLDKIVLPRELANGGDKAKILKEYQERLDYELGVINNMDFPGYFLIVSDFIIWSKSQNIPVGPGRGSGAGSLVAWSLEITDLDPIYFGLFFERFLNPERISMPDFDIDFCQERRDEVIAYVQQRYGHNHVAQIITFGKLQARVVLRDVGRVLQLPYGQIDRICKLIPFNPLEQITLSKAIKMDPELRREMKQDPQIAELIEIGLQLEGLYRHASTHAAGVVIGSKPLTEIIPLYNDFRSDIAITQFSMKYAEMAGLVKFDFLGLKTLTTISKAIEIIKQQGTEIDINTIPMDDKASFEMLSNGIATGVFQMESSGMKDALRKMKPDCIEDIIALISLYRPGPMENIPTYIARKHGREKPDYPHPLLEPCLKETFGVIIYQEQVMEIAKVLGGYSLGAADLLRRAMGKKIKSEMDAQAEIFIKGAAENNIDKKKATEIFDLVAKFAGYGFNKSHAAAYALIGYQTAYLKANYPVEFLAASMNMDIENTDKLLLYKEEATRLGIAVLPPDINKSEALFSVEKLDTKPKDITRNRAIRFGLAALKNVGLVAMEELVETRKSISQFKSLEHMSENVSAKVMNKRQIENLAKSGAFDCLNDGVTNRKQLSESAALLSRYNQTILEEKEANQTNLFGDAGSGDNVTLLQLPKVDDWQRDERLLMEYEAIGFYLSEHPLDSYVLEMKQAGIMLAKRLNEQTQDQKVKLAGIPTNIIHRAANGRRFAYLKISDPTGSIEISLFDEDLINNSQELIEGNAPLLIKADARFDEGGGRILGESIQLLDDALQNQLIPVAIYIEDIKAADKLKTLINSAERGSIQLTLICPTAANMNTSIKLPKNYTVKSEKLDDIKMINGINLV